MSRTFNANVSNRLQIGTIRTPPLQAYPLSIFCQFRRDFRTDFQSVVMFGDSSGALINDAHATGILIRGSGANNTVALYRVAVAEGNTLDLTAGAAPIDTWTRVAVSVNASNFMSGMVDGGTHATMQGTINPRLFDNLCVGARLMYNTPDGPFLGDVAHVAVWNVGLSEGEQRALTLGAHPFRVRPESLVAHYLLTGSSTGDEQDRIGNFYLSEFGTVGVDESMLQPLWWPSLVDVAAGPPAGEEASGTHTAPPHEMDALASVGANADGVQTAPMHTMAGVGDFVVPETAQGVHTAPAHTMQGFATFLVSATGIQTAPAHQMTGLAAGPEQAEGIMWAPPHTMAGAAAFSGGQWVEQPPASGVWQEQ